MPFRRRQVEPPSAASKSAALLQRQTGDVQGFDPRIRRRGWRAGCRGIFGFDQLDVLVDGLIFAAGVGLAVPSIYFFALFRNRVSHISVTTVVAATISCGSFRTRPGAKSPRDHPSSLKE